METIRRLWDNEYSIQNHLQIEEILLDKLDWNLRVITSSELTQRLKDLIWEFAENQNMIKQFGGERLRSLAMVFTSEEFEAKVSTFTQIALIGKLIL